MVPRCVQLEFRERDVAEYQLHVFSDASDRAYGSVAYLRTLYKDGTICSRLVIGKAKVTPLDHNSIPRLELVAAVLSISLMHSVLQPLDLTRSQVFFWVDSQVVLTWIFTMSKVLKTFVANRIGQIHEETLVGAQAERLNSLPVGTPKI